MVAINSVGVTATREPLSEPQSHAFYHEVLKQIRAGATEVHHGACTGGDAFIHWHIAEMPSIWLHVHPPVDPKHSAMASLKRSVRRVDHEPKTYAERNGDIVEAADVLVAAPRYPEKDPKSARSGTWQTARKAKAADILTIIVDYVDGKVWVYHDPSAPKEPDSKAAA
jgi:hypothetical protein